MLALEPKRQIVLDEATQIIRDRFDEAVRYGWGRLEAQLYADSDVSASELRRLHRKGCAPDVASRILL